MDSSIPTITKYKENKANPINFSCAIITQRKSSHFLRLFQLIVSTLTLQYELSQRHRSMQSGVIHKRGGTPERYPQALVDKVLRVREMYNWFIANPDGTDREFVADGYRTSSRRLTQ